MIQKMVKKFFQLNGFSQIIMNHVHKKGKNNDYETNQLRYGTYNSISVLFFKN